MQRLVAFAASLSCTVGVLACSQSGSPASPSAAAAPVVEDQTADAVSVGLTGAIRRLDVEGHSLVLQTRGGNEMVRANERTEVWRAGSRVRFGELKIGMTVGVRAVQQRGYVLARVISIM